MTPVCHMVNPSALLLPSQKKLHRTIANHVLNALHLSLFAAKQV